MQFCSVLNLQIEWSDHLALVSKFRIREVLCIKKEK